jgi:hypothetical protein
MPRTPDEATIEVDSLGERVGLAGRGNESDLAESGLEDAAGYVQRVRNDVVRPLDTPFSL